MSPEEIAPIVGAGVAVYEAVALLAKNDRIPPITRIARKHPLIAGALVAALVIHFRPDGPF